MSTAVWLPSEIASQLVIRPFKLDNTGRTILSDRSVASFGLGKAGKNGLLAGIDTALAEIRRMDLARREVISQSAEETTISIKPFAEEAEVVREDFLAVLGEAFGEEEATVVFGMLGDQMNRLTSNWGTMDRTLTFRPTPDGNIETVYKIDGVRGRSIGTAPREEFRHLVEFEAPKKKNIPDPLR